MKYQSLFSGKNKKTRKNKKTIINLLSAEFVQIVVKGKDHTYSLKFLCMVFFNLKKVTDQNK